MARKQLNGQNQNNTPLINVPAPTNGGDAANKTYVDTAVGNIQIGQLSGNTSNAPLIWGEFAANVLQPKAGTGFNGGGNFMTIAGGDAAPESNQFGGTLNIRGGNADGLGNGGGSVNITGGNTSGGLYPGDVSISGGSANDGSKGKVLIQSNLEFPNSSDGIIMSNHKLRIDPTNYQFTIYDSNGVPVYQKRTTSSTSSSVLRPDLTASQHNRDGQSTALVVQAPTGTPIDGQETWLRVKDDGTARAITWASDFRPLGLSLPASTVANTTLYALTIYNAADNKWDVVKITSTTSGGTLVPDADTSIAINNGVIRVKTDTLPPIGGDPGNSQGSLLVNNNGHMAAITPYFDPSGDGSLNMSNRRILGLGQPPDQGDEAVNKDYVDNNTLLRTGGSMDGEIDMQGYAIRNLPENDLRRADAAPKVYVDNTAIAMAIALG